MQKVHNSALKLISGSQEQGITLDKLTQALESKFAGIFSFKPEDLLQILQNNKEVQITKLKNEETAKSTLLKTTKDLEYSFNKRFLLNIHFKNDEGSENENIFKIYELIVKAGDKGITYSALCDVLNKKSSTKASPAKKIDSYMVSNYCCKLEKKGFVRIKFNKSWKIVFWRKHHPFTVANPRLRTSLKETEEKPKPEVESVDDNDADFPEPEPRKKVKGSYVGQDSILDTLREDTFIFNELPQRFNIAMNLQSYDTYKKGGLTMKELGILVNMRDEKKTMDRIMKAMHTSFKIKSTAYRDGKSFSHKVLIVNNKLEAFYDKEPSEIHDNEQVGVESKSQKDNALTSDAKSVMEIEPILDNPLLSYDVYTDLLEIFENNSQLLNALNGPEALKTYQETKLADRVVYKKRSEDLLQILVENVERNAHKVKKEDAEGADNEAKNSFSKKALTRLKLNRIIFILNKVKQTEIISAIDLKNYITAEIESATGWKIDRKTLRTLLEVLERFGLIKLLDFEFSLRSNKEKEIVYRKTIVTDRKIDPEDERVKSNPALSNPTLRRDRDIPETIKEKESFIQNSTRSKLTRSERRREAAESRNGRVKIEHQADDMQIENGKRQRSGDLLDTKKHMQDLQNKFEMMTEDNVEDKLKKIDFASCKMLAIEYKLMIFEAFLSQVIERSRKRARQYTFKCLINQMQRSFLDKLTSQKVIPPKEFCGFTKYSGIDTDDTDFEFDTSMREYLPVLKEDGQGLQLPEKVFASIDKEINHHNATRYSVVDEINHIIQGSLSFSHHSDGLADKAALYLLGESHRPTEHETASKSLMPEFNTLIHLRNQSQSESYHRLNSGLEAMAAYIAKREVCSYIALKNEFGGKVDVSNLVYSLILNEVASAKKIVHGTGDQHGTVMETLDVTNFLEEAGKSGNAIYVLNQA